MILIDAIYINNGGGKILLDYLISQINNTNLEIHYLIDSRIENKHCKVVNGTFEYFPSNWILRKKYYLLNDEEAKSISERAMNRAAEEHTWEKRFQELRDIIIG
jgi:hypothetical protein